MILMQTRIVSLPIRMLAAITVAVVGISIGEAGMLDEVKQRGYVRCGVNTGFPGFAQESSDGIFVGFDIDYCRALAAAIFDNAEAVRYTELNATDRFSAVVDGKIDVLARNTTWSMRRDVTDGEFIGVNFFDGQGFMARRSLGIGSAQELNGAKVCVTRNTTIALNAADYFELNRVPVKLMEFDETTEATRAYEEGKCDVFTSERSSLVSQMNTLSKPDAHIVLPEIISKEPLGPWVPVGDSKWTDIARWTLHCMVNAEELGVTRRNVNRLSNSKVPSIRRLLGIEGEFGESLGLANTWCYNVVALVGNYGESYDRHIGPGTPLNLRRGVNELWTNGGILYAPPIR